MLLQQFKRETMHNMLIYLKVISLILRFRMPSAPIYVSLEQLQFFPERFGQKKVLNNLKSTVNIFYMTINFDKSYENLQNHYKTCVL